MIHYHGTPTSSRQNAARILAARHALVSYAEPSCLDVVAEVAQSFVLDNGAFTYHRRGEPMTDWSGYYRWAGPLLRLPGCDWAVIPDAIGGTEEENDALLDEWPFHRHQGVPVYHLHESLDRLQRLVHTWPRVALGSSGDFWQVGSGSWWIRMGVAMDVACDQDGYPLAKLHGLRMLNWRVFSRLPLASADSVNVGMNCGRTAKLYDTDPVAGAEVIARRVEAHNSLDRWDRP